MSRTSKRRGTKTKVIPRYATKGSGPYPQFKYPPRSKYHRRKKATAA